MKTITLQEIIAARRVVTQYLKPTPLVHYPELSERLGFQAYIKHENHHPTGSFKVRGGINFMHHLPQAQREKGVLTATRGNHGQSIAYAAQQFGVKATVVVPHGNNPEKNCAMRAYGAELIEHGSDFDEALALCETLQAERGLYYVHPCMELALFHGVGTYSLEIFESLPDVDVIIVPIGGGSGSCGAITVSKAINPTLRSSGCKRKMPRLSIVRGSRDSVWKPILAIPLPMGLRPVLRFRCRYPSSIKAFTTLFYSARRNLRKASVWRCDGRTIWRKGQVLLR